MAHCEGRALVLDCGDYRESSSLIRILTEEDGRISLIGRGLRKPRTGGSAIVQPFNLIYVRYILKDGQALGTLTGYEIIRSWSAPRSNLSSYALATYWFEILQQTSQARDSLSQIFEGTIEFLESQEVSAGLSVAFIVQLSNLCRALGFGLHWSECSICGKAAPEPELFSIKTGLICNDCGNHGRQGMLLRPDENLFIRHHLQMPLQTEPMLPSVAVLLDVLSLINRFLVYHLEHPLRSFSFVQSTHSA